MSARKGDRFFPLSDAAPRFGFAFVGPFGVDSADWADFGF
jgi:hypothetical protein